MDLLTFLNIQTKKISTERIELSLHVEDCHKQPFGILHGGMNGVLIETACSMGANTMLKNTAHYSVGVDLQVNHLKSVTEGELTIIATPNHIGQSIQVWEGKIMNEHGETTSIGRCTLMNKTTKN